MERENTTNQSAVSEAESVDLLKRLGLTEGEIAELRQQGFMAHERRRGQSDVFKLRFRINGRQQVRYVGTSPIEAKRVELAVKTLQRAKRAQCEMRKLQQESRVGLKAAKSLLSPVLKAAGYQFHGLSVRHSRS